MFKIWFMWPEYLFQIVMCGHAITAWANDVCFVCLWSESQLIAINKGWTFRMHSLCVTGCRRPSLNRRRSNPLHVSYTAVVTNGWTQLNRTEAKRTDHGTPITKFSFFWLLYSRTSTFPSYRDCTSDYWMRPTHAQLNLPIFSSSIHFMLIDWPKNDNWNF